MRDKLYRFMQGRNGMDDLCRMESGLVLVLLILGIFTRLGIFTTVALLLMIHMYYRALSKNTAKRYEENQKYLNFKIQPYSFVESVQETYGTDKRLPFL